MTNADIREAHKLLDSLFDNSELSHAQIDLIRGLVPELPKQKTLEEIVHDVYEAWIASSGDKWIRDGVVGSVISLEDWLKELHEQLKGLKDTPAVSPVKPTHPEFLETEADYENAPEGTIVACDDSPPWHKSDSAWLSTTIYGGNRAKSMAGVIREVLRWGWGNE